MTITLIGCGWLGLALGEQLQIEGHSVYGSSRNGAKFEELKSKGIQPFLYNLETDSALPSQIVEASSVVIITVPPIQRSSPGVYGKCLELLINQFPKSTRVIFTSSTGVYPKTDGLFTEEFVFNSKEQDHSGVQAEASVSRSNNGAIILRLAGLIGPNRHPIWSLKGKSGLQNPNGPINFVHREDVIRAILALISAPSASGIFNVVHPLHPSRKAHYEKAAEYYGVPVPTFEDSLLMNRIISGEKLCSKLDFSYENPIEVFPSVIWH